MVQMSLCSTRLVKLKVKSSQKPTLPICRCVDCAQIHQLLGALFSVKKGQITQEKPAALEVWGAGFNECVCSAHQPCMTIGPGTQSALCLQTRGTVSRWESFGKNVLEPREVFYLTYLKQSSQGGECCFNLSPIYIFLECTYLSNVFGDITLYTV